MSQTTAATVATGAGWSPRSRPARDGGQRPFSGVLSDSQAVLDYTAELMAAVEEEIEDLWRDTIGGGDRRLSDRLVDLSRALRRAALVLEQEPVIGLHAPSPATHVHSAQPVPGVMSGVQPNGVGRSTEPSPTPDGLEILLTRDREQVVVCVSGSVTATTSSSLALVLATLLAEAVSCVVLDLSAVTAFDADRVWMIGEAARLFQEHGSGFTVRGPNATVGEVANAGHAASTQVHCGPPSTGRRAREAAAERRLVTGAR